VVDAGADVYALGSVVYEMLTGVPPYPPPAMGEVTNRMIRDRLSHMPVPPSLANPAVNLPSWVDDVVLWALAHDPTARYGSAVAFAHIFRAGLDGAEAPDEASPEARSPIEARPAARAAEPMAPPSAAAVTVPTHLGRDGSPGALSLRDGPLAEQTASLRRLLWWAVAVLVVVNLLLAILLLVTQGRLPGVYEPALLAPLSAMAQLRAAGP
jgi:serine/threonine-protein kinase